jgi:UDP:flavonoid glycosyltransferase YjiC (YdhE family)
MSALRRGVPVVAVPLGAADHGLNAARLAATGAGLVVPERARGVDAVRAATRALLGEPAYAGAARRLAAATAELAPLTAAAPLVERLATGRRPVPRPA